VRPFLLLFSAISLCAAADLPVVHVRNFDKVNDYLYRGGEPSAVGIQELGAMGVKTIIDLRQAQEGTALEKALAEKLKLKYVNIPMGEFSAPSNAQMEQILGLLSDNSGTLFVHCRRGKDRTGTVIACYRIQHDGWNNQRAFAEAKEHGMSSFERAMRSYILHFTPLTLPGLGQPGVAAPTAAK
jgi:protein tyrosine/serine phosphatase